MSSTVHSSERFGDIDVSNLLGIQTALAALGYDPGDLDGLDGPNTKGAVRAFQVATGIDVDGIPGRMTKQALIAALDQAATPDGTAESAIASAADLVKSMMG